MSVVQSIMDFIRGRELEQPVAVPASLPHTSAVGAPATPPPTPPIREGYMPENSGYVNKAWKDSIKSRGLKNLVKKAEESEDEHRARVLSTAKEPDSRYDAANVNEVKWTDADKIRSMEARARLEEGERKREEARLKAKSMRQP